MSDEPSTIELARAAIKRLAEQRLALTPENYAAAWVACGGRTGVVDPGEHAQVQRRLERSERTLLDLQRLLAALCEGVGALADDDSWLGGQMATLRELLDSNADRRAVSAARQLLEQTALTQQRIVGRKREAVAQLRETLFQAVGQTVELDSAAGELSTRVQHWAGRIEAVDTPEARDEAVRRLAADARALHASMDDSRERFAATRDRALALREEVARLERELCEASRQMHTDHLTHALNRRGLDEAWRVASQRAARLGQPLSLALLDVDDFKRLNDALGHLAGDGALQHLARLLKARLRPGDSVARFGGEEFVLLLPDSAGPQAAAVMQRMQRELTSDVYLFENRQVFLTFSAGVAEMRSDETFDAVVARADEAMYRAKRAGKNCVQTA